MSANLLESKSSIKQLDIARLTELRETVSELINSVINSDAEASLKKYVTHHLRQILNAIDEYKITGALPILDAVESTIGHAYLDKGYHSYLTSTEMGRQILDTLGAVANLVTIAVGIPVLTHSLLMLAGGN